MERTVHEKICEYCHNRFKFKAFPTEAVVRRFCCKTCSNKGTSRQNSLSKTGNRNPMYKTGLYMVADSRGTYRKILNDIKECQMCGKVGIISNYGLLIHHIDKDRKHNELSNLLVICKRCHYKVHNPKGGDARHE